MVYSMISKLFNRSRILYRKVLKKLWKKPPYNSRLKDPSGAIFITGFGVGGFYGVGKVDSEYFFPPFCKELESAGLKVSFFSKPDLYNNSPIKPASIIHIYGEDHEIEEIGKLGLLEEGGPLIFNSLNTGLICADKGETNRILSENGILTPSMNLSGEVIFSNSSAFGSSRPVELHNDAGQVDPSHYNTDFIDTAVTFNNQDYYTSIRILCVGPYIVHGWVRARNAEEGDPCVRSVGTPKDAGLLEYLQKIQVTDRIIELEDIAEKIYQCLGAGFYVHDLLVEKDSGKIYVCETGFKFNDSTYPDPLEDIKDQMPSHDILFSDELPKKAARAFLKTCAREGVYQS